MVRFSQSTLMEIGACDDSRLDLIDVALLLAQMDDPQADLDAAYNHIAAATLEIDQLAHKNHSPQQQAQALADVLHGRYAYTGDQETYDDPTNATLLSVIARRKGLPVTLSILYLGIAQRLGWDAAGLNVPAHFIIRIGTNDNHVLQDPFHGGVVLNHAEVLRKIAPLGLPQPMPSIFQPMPARAILVRLLNNISARAEAQGDLLRALAIYERMTMIAPQFTGLWWERARIERQLGHLSTARRSLDRMLTTTQDPALKQSVEQLIAQLSRTLN